MYRKTLTHFGAFLLALCLLFAVGGSISHAQDVPQITADELADLVKANEDKVVVVNIFASWCGPCTTELPGLVEVRKKYSPDQVFMIGVSIDDSVAEVVPLFKQFGFNYPIYIADGTFSEDLEIESIPMNFIFSPGSELIYGDAGILSEKDLAQYIDGALK